MGQANGMISNGEPQGIDVHTISFGSSMSKWTSADDLARAGNEFAAKIRDSDPYHLGFLAPPPFLDNIDATIAEINYTLDVLKADGITLHTVYGEGNNYLGYVKFRPVWEVLNARKAVIILSHAGGSLHYLVTRAAHLLADAGLAQITANEYLEGAPKFYFDTALSGNEFMLPTLLDFASPGYVLFGPDFPYAPVPTIDTLTRAGMRVLAERKGDKDSELAVNASMIFGKEVQIKT
ncbi:hypothetical protein K469DRAFT_691503 [Zopfia rhizophila CBS 207.26]|uniref:Amidohydrolase-related domain-containing protein n=1 Tax=Zopfia rhizophila CBS 207.26 TaxID=1314779 RepID=A0A6A6DV92_9PEZI|nr:hypothetical protein K469DRAFT_691503 [Zopfia rhizophila CBS 207.26]